MKEIIILCEEITGKTIPFNNECRREGDPAVLIADTKKSLRILKWSPKKILSIL